jgi:DNA-binding LytR/AlgR family response regulator
VPRFLERVPPAARGRLLALEMEDHYLRVHTDSGSALILHRMSDATAELAGIDGWRVHRSWWVAADAVRTVRRDGGRATLMLENGLEVPVSRSAWPALRDRLRAVPSA